MGLWRKIQRTLGTGGRRRQIPSDVYIVSFPKCGRTWLALQLARAIQQHWGLGNVDLLRLRKLCDARRDIPKIAPTHDDNPQWHTAEEQATDKSRYAGRKVILLVRDPRDVLVSNYFQRKKRVKVPRRWFFFKRRGRERQAPFDGELADFLRWPVGGIDAILRFYEVWAEKRSVPAGFLLVRYEDMKSDAKRELRRALDFAGLSAVSDALVDDAVQFASFENMRKMEASGASRTGILRPGDKSDKESFKTRRGKVGGYVDYLTPEQVEMLNAKMRERLPPMYGYEPCRAPGA